VYQSLSAMPKYQSLSHEEMRLKEELPIVANQAPHAGNGFGTAPSKPQQISPSATKERPIPASEFNGFLL